MNTERCGDSVISALKKIHLVPTSDSVFLGSRNTPDAQCAKFRRLTQNLIKNSELGKLDELYSKIEKRIVLMDIDGMNIMEESGSFRRVIGGETFTKYWAHISEEHYRNYWRGILPVRSDDYYWWQITGLEPKVDVGEFHLFSIEVNSRFLPHNTYGRADEFSKFAVVFAKDNEVEELKNLLEGPDFN